MLKLLMILSLLITSLNANKIEDEILKFEKSRIKKNKRVKLNDIKLFFKKDLNENGWVGYVFNLNITIQGKDVDVKDIIFSNGKMISPDLVSIRTKQSFKKIMYPKLSVKYYDKKFLIAGNKDAKHKIVIFSDPLCPNCIDTMPELIQDVRMNPKTLSLYYISMPLDMHPTARTMVQASILAHKKGVVYSKGITYKVYTSGFEKDFDSYDEKDKEKVLKIFNKKLNTNFTMKQINSKEILKEVEYELKLADEAMVQGTPTIFFNGVIDPMRNKYLKYIK